MVGHDGAPIKVTTALSKKLKSFEALIRKNSKEVCLWLSRGAHCTAPWDGESTAAAGERDDRVAVAVERPLGVPRRVGAQTLEDPRVDGHRSRGLLVINSYKRSMALRT